MAAKSKAETLAQWQAYADLFDTVYTFLNGNFSTKVQACLTQIDTGDEQPEQAVQRQAMMSLLNGAGGAFWNSMVSAVAPIHHTLARYAGGANPVAGGPSTNLAAFNDKLQTDNENLEKRGLTKSTFAAGGSNTGSGRIVQITTDANGDDLDCAHVSTMKLRCTNGGQGNAQIGSEAFELVGGVHNFSWEEGGISDDGNDYVGGWGVGIYDFGQGVQIASSGLGRSLVSMSGRSSLNGVASNADFERDLIGTGVNKIPGFTIISGDTNIDVETTSPIKGDSSLQIKGNCVFYTLIKTSLISPKTHVAFGGLIKKVIDTGTLTGTFTIHLRSGGVPGTAASGTSHGSISVTVGGLTDNTVTNEDTAILLPKTVGSNLRLEYTMTSYSASDADNELLWDETYFGKMYLIDGQRSIIVLSGVTDWKTDDLFTVTVSSAEGGTMQRFINRVFGRHLVSDTAATYWSDY